jgi:hypothetical protein
MFGTSFALTNTNRQRSRKKTTVAINSVFIRRNTMGRFQKIISFITFSVMVLGLTVVASAQYRDQRRNNGYYGNQNLEGSIKSLVSQARRFEDTLDRELDRSRLDGSRQEDQLNKLAEKFKNAAENLDDEYDGYRDQRKSTDEARKMLNRAAQLDQALSASRIGRRSNQVRQAWNMIETQLATMSRAFNYNHRGTCGRKRNGRYGKNDRRNRNGNTNGRYGNTNGRYGNVGSTISSLKYKARNLEDQLDNDRNNRGNGNLENLSDRFKNAVDDLAKDYTDRDGGYDEMQKVLRIGQQLDGEMSRGRTSRNVRRQWASIETDLRTLARAYNVSYNGNRGRNTIGDIFRRLPF